MKLLLIGSGGREHALAWKLKQSPLCTTLVCAPGNPGIAAVADETVSVALDDIPGLVALARARAVDLVVPGPETPLVLGLADALEKEGIAVFGPTAAAARLEGSKGFTKDLCAKYEIPTAAYARFTDLEKAKAYIAKRGAPIVVKADGLAAGKGVAVAQSVEEAQRFAADCLAAGPDASLVIEDFLDGEELSYFVLTDGRTVVPLTSAQDHKRVFDGDKGPNTGGMGAYSPAHLLTPALEGKILERIIWPTVDAMAREGCPFRGVLYAGIMAVNGEPYLIEYNVRFGDPECQVLMPRMEGDLVELMLACARGTLREKEKALRWKPETALCVVMAARGYPGAYEKGAVIGGLAAAAAIPDVTVFQAGTARDPQGALTAAGGRVLGVTACGPDVAAAQKTAYRAVDAIDWPGGFCRRDIGWRALLTESERAQLAVFGPGGRMRESR